MKTHLLGPVDRLQTLISVHEKLSVRELTRPYVDVVDLWLRSMTLFGPVLYLPCTPVQNQKHQEHVFASHKAMALALRSFGWE
jgi:hypothetical protein